MTSFRDWTPAQIAEHNAKVARDAQAARENLRPVRKLNDIRAEKTVELIKNGPPCPPKPEKASEGTKKPRRATEMNRTEAEYGLMLKAQFPGAVIHWEAYVLRLANRCTYCPDFSVFHEGKLSFWEVKGSFVFPKALVKPRIAAVMFPHHKFTLAQKTKQGWKITEFPNA